MDSLNKVCALMDVVNNKLELLRQSANDMKINFSPIEDRFFTTILEAIQCFPIADLETIDNVEIVESEPEPVARILTEKELIDLIIDKYNEILGDYLPKVKMYSDKLIGDLRDRLTENKDLKNITWWIAYFDYVTESDFLTGKTTDWRANLEFLVNKANMAKVVNGNYANKIKQARKLSEKAEMTLRAGLNLEKEIYG